MPTAGNLKLTDALVEACVVKQSQGFTYDAIREWLVAEYNISVTVQCLSRRINNQRKQRQAMTAAVVTNIVAKKVTADLEAMEDLISRALDDEIRARSIAWNLGKDEKGEPTTNTLAGSELWTRLMHVVKASRGNLMDALALRLKLAGADRGDDKKADPESIKQQLMEKLDRLVESASGFKPPAPTNTPHFLQ